MLFLGEEDCYYLTKRKGKSMQASTGVLAYYNDDDAVWTQINDSQNVKPQTADMLANRNYLVFFCKIDIPATLGICTVVAGMLSGGALFWTDCFFPVQIITPLFFPGMQRS